MALGDDFTSALEASNNTLTQTPALAVDAATSGDPANAGLLLSHAAATQAMQDAAQQDQQNQDQNKNSGGGLWHTLTHAAGRVAHTAAHGIAQGASMIPGGQAVVAFAGLGAGVATHGTQALNAPLQQVQANYRYNHEVYARQGIIPGALVTLGMAGGAAAGGYASDSATGAILGAEAVGEGERGLARAGVFGDQYKQDALLADAKSTQISPGRDLSHGLAYFPGLASLNDTNKGWGKLVSGATDATFDLSTDPVLKAGGIYKDLKYGSDQAVAKGSIARDFLSKITGGAPGLRAANPESVDQLYHSTYWGGGYRRAITQIAGMNAGDITARFGGQLDGLAGDTTLANGTVVKGLASASTPEEVNQVFKRAISDNEMAQRMFNGTLPSRSLLRSTGGKVAEWVRNIDPQGAVSDQRGMLLPTKTGPGLGGLSAPAALSAPAKVLTGDFAGATQDIAGAVARKVRTFSGYLPFAMDKDTLALSRRTFDPMNPNSLQGVYRSLKYSMGEQDARLWTDRFAQAQTLTDKKRIWAEANMEMLKAAGLPDSPEMLEQVTRGTRQVTMGPAGSEVYGAGLNTGRDVSKVDLGNGSLDDMALWSDQRGNFSFPDYFKVKQAVRDMHGWTDSKYGSFDDFVANNYTNKIFKPLALMNAGFGLRVAFSEAIPAALRHGLLNQLTAKVVTSAAKVNYKLDPDRLTGQADNLMSRADAAEAAGNAAGAATYRQQANDIYAKASTRVEHYHVLSAMSKLMGGASKMLGATDEERDLAARIVMANEGHIVKGVADTAHGSSSFYLPDDPNLRGEAVIHYGKQWLNQRGLAPTGDYAMFGSDSNHFLESWKQELQKRSQNEQAQNITRDLLNAHLAGKDTSAAASDAIAAETARIKDPNAYRFDKQVVGRYSAQTPEHLAADRVDAMQGLLVGQDGTFHADLAQMLADGEKPTLQHLEPLDPNARPKQVMGEVYEPWLGGGRLDSLISMGFRRMVDPVINKLSREPTYYNAVKQEWDNLAYLRAHGLDDETALRTAQYRGSLAMLPQIHNTDLRTQFHGLARNYLPFFFAQQQAVQRAAILVAQNPNAARGLQMVYHGLNDPGFVQNDGSGNRYLMMPIVGDFGKLVQNGAASIGLPMVAGLPVTAMGSMASLNTVLPEAQLPGVAPLVSVPMNAFSSLSDEVHAPWANSFAGLTKAILGSRGYGAAFFDSVMPNQFIRNTIMAASPDEQSRSFSNAMLQAVASAYYHGQVPPPSASPADQQAFLDRIRNNARSLFMVKALVGLVSPLSPSVSQEDPGFSNEFYALVKKQGYSKAIDTFIAEHGSSAVSYTVAHTDAATQGASLPYTQKAMDWIQSNNGLVTGPYATGAAFLVPQDPSGGDVQKISNELLKMNLRARRTPQDFLNAIYIAAGNSAQFADKKVYDEALKAVGNNSQMQQVLQTAWSQHTASMAFWNPVWYNDYASPIRKNTASLAYADLQNIFANGLAPEDQQSTDVKALMDAYGAYQVQSAALGNSRTAGADSSRQALQHNWSAFLDEQMNTNPNLAPVIRAVFARLPDTNAAINSLNAGTASLASVSS